MYYLSINRSILKHLLSDLSKTNVAKDFLNAVSLSYKVCSNAEIGTLVKELYPMRCDGV